MLRDLTDIQRGLIVSSILFSTTFLNYYFNTGSYEASCFCITIGFALGFYFFLENKILPYILVGTLASHIISRLVLTDEIFIDILFTSIGQTLVSILVIYILKKITVSFGIIDKVNLRSLVIFVLSTILVSVLAGVLVTNIMLLGDSSLDILQLFIKWSTGYFFGITVFGITIIYSYFYNEGISTSTKQHVMAVIFIGIFIFISSALFSNTISWFTFDDYSYVFILFYIILSLVFTYRMILLTNVLFVVIYQLFFIKLGHNVDYPYIILSMNLYLLILSTLSSTVKMVLYELEIKNKALVTSNRKLESLVYSTDSLLKLSNDILDTDVKVHEDYLSRIFKIACNIFDNYDYAACYIKEDPYVNFIDSVGYDADILNNLKYKSDDIDLIDTEHPTHIANEDESLQRVLRDEYDEFHKHYPVMTEAIRFGIYIDENTIGGISFDISKDSGKKFNNEEFENLKSFQKLMNSFFSINYLNYKNISLKNDIVLSLIRTLELFDQYTGGHSEEVAYLSNEIAKRSGLDEYETHDIYWAGVVHDIGKVGIDSSIINKPAKLSLEEYELIKEHSMFGYEILNKAEDLKNIAILVKHHHEWWNGAGYPSGLKGEAIPIGSQIISVCDAVSTMAKKRPYTIVKTSREIIEELEMYSGVQFSPEPTKHMIDYIKEGYLDEFYKNR